MAQVDICIYPSGYTLDAAELAKYDPANRYTSMSSMEAGTDIDWVSATDNPVVDILEGDVSNNWSGNPDTNKAHFNGATLSATYPMLIRTLGTARSADGNWDTDAYILQEDGDYSIYFDEGNLYLQCDGLQLEQAGTTGSIICWPRDIANVEFKNCYFYYNSSVDNVCVYYDEIAGSKILRFWNCIFENGNYGVRILDDTVYMYHCLITGSTSRGTRTSTTASYLKNVCIFNTANDYDGTYGEISYNANDDGDGTNTVALNENAGGEWTASFTNYLARDYTIKDTSVSSLLYNAGDDLSSEFTDLTGDTDPLKYDIVGNDRSATWDIGPFVFPAVGPASAIMNQFQKNNLGADLYNGSLI